MLALGLKINRFGTGKWFDDGLNTDLVKVTFKYGETLTDIGMTLEENVEVTASVNNGEMGSIACNANECETDTVQLKKKDSEYYI